MATLKGGDVPYSDMPFLPRVLRSVGPVGSESRPLRSAAVLLVVVAATFAVVPRFEAPFASPVHRLMSALVGFLWWEWYVVGLVVGIAVVAFYHGSAIEALALGFAGGAGVGINLGGIGINSEVPGLLFRLLWAAGLGAAFGVSLGGVGYLLGAGVRRAVGTRDGE